MEKAINEMIVIGRELRNVDARCGMDATKPSIGAVIIVGHQGKNHEVTFVMDGATGDVFDGRLACQADSLVAALGGGDEALEAIKEHFMPAPAHLGLLRVAFTAMIKGGDPAAAVRQAIANNKQGV